MKYFVRNTLSLFIHKKFQTDVFATITYKICTIHGISDRIIRKKKNNIIVYILYYVLIICEFNLVILFYLHEHYSFLVERVYLQL